MRNIDPGNEFGYKELTRLWIAEKGHPQTAEERTVLKEVAKNHTYGKPQKCEPTPPPQTPSPKSASSVRYSMLIPAFICKGGTLDKFKLNR